MSTVSGQTKQEPKEDKLLTKPKLWAVFFVQLNEAYQITVLLPMVVFMVRDFGIAPELLGIYTSILNASFCFCQFLCCYAWGLLSDKFGRRISLMIGLVFSTIAITLFGFSKNFGTAIAARCISGFFNGNLGVIKAYLADITDHTNRAFAFSTLAISYGFGSVIGSMCGGIFIETHDVDVPDDEYIKTVGIIKWWIFENDYPFLLPCLLGTLISANALIFTFIFIHNENVLHLPPPTKTNDAETNENNQTKQNNNDYESLKSSDNVYTIEDHEGGYGYPQSLNALSKLAVFETCPGDGLHSMNLSAHPFSLRSHATQNTEFQGLLMANLKNKKDGKNGTDGDCVKFNQDEDYSTVFALVFKSKLYNSLLVWTLLIMGFMMYQEMNPVYMAQALGFSSQLIGYAMAFSGFALLIFTYYIQPYFLHKFKFRPMCIICGAGMTFIALQMPSIYTIKEASNFENEQLTSLMLAFANSIGGVCFGSIMFVCIMCWVNNAVPNHCVGRANGVAQSMAALVRAVGPALTGFIWSGSVTHIETNTLAVYYAYLPSFICFLTISLWTYLYIGHDAQLFYEQRKEKQKIMRASLVE